MKKLLIGLAVVSVIFAACNGKMSVSTNGVAADSTAAMIAKNKQTAINSEMAILKKDIDGIYKDCSADFVDYGSEEYKPMTKIDSLKINMKQFLDAFPDMKVENMKAFADSNTVVITGTWSGTFTKEFMKIPPTKKTYKLPDADIFTFNKEGKITSHRSIQSEIAYLTQLGVPLPPKK
ncbi:ester cyclase [Mucilaginibacter sp. HMF5004]|uniref:ester cyclase n=1 Tax=Mucilaginibacter rivuli TaxID=2857527 RepID=UPI001C604B0A|nr:ester cyclase [Mucilaginibacter rivuli]MBW4889420.1 ester cyclase [Mucilaginibacter rivuli]